MYGTADLPGAVPAMGSASAMADGAPPLEIRKKKKKKSSLPDDGLNEREFFKKYWIESGKLGEGAFSRVRKITRKDDKAQFALKVVKKKGKAKEDIIALQKEIYVLQKCDHSHIVNLLDWCDTKKRIYMVVEFCDGGDVFERVIADKKFTEKDAAHVIKQVAHALEHLHMFKFVHRDLKPDNLMYLTKEKDSPVKVIDLGLAGDFNDGACTTPCGTAHYAAPEVLAGDPYDSQADMWSLGVILYTLLCGFPPFFDTLNDMKNLYHMIKRAKYSFPSPFWDDISDLAKDLIKKCLLKDSRERLTAKQVLKHEWLTGGAPDTGGAFSEDYLDQMKKYASSRHATERKIGAPAASDESATAHISGPAPYRPGVMSAGKAPTASAVTSRPAPFRP
jgi:serine/threonine protein kinase